MGVLFWYATGMETLLSRITIVPTAAPGMARWRKRLFIVIARNAANPVALFGLPDKQTVVLSAHIEL